MRIAISAISTTGHCSIVTRHIFARPAAAAVRFMTILGLGIALCVCAEVLELLVITSVSYNHESRGAPHFII